MRSRSFVALACALSAASVFSCSDDDGGTPGGGGTNQTVNPLNPGGGGGMSGNAGSTNGGSANAGAANGGSGGGSSGSDQGGSANNAGGGGGSGGDGMGGTTMAGAGGEGGTDMGDPPDAGGGDPPDEPDDEAVVFGDIFPILRASCGGCHGNANGGPPAFAQVNEAAAFAVTQNTGAQGMDISQRIIVRAVMARTMPPGCNNQNFGQGTCIEADEAASLQAWFDQGAQE